MKNLPIRLKENGQFLLSEKGAPAVCSREAFVFLLKRERARADRGCGIFSLVIFDLHENRGKASSRRLINVLKGRVRITDSIGWLGPFSIGVLLADAPNAGGQVFLNDVLQTLSGIQPAPECHVYTYPAAAAGNGTGPADSSPEDKEAARTERVFNEMLAVHPSLGRQVAGRIAAGFALIVLSPLMLLIALVIKRSSPGPALYSQWRIGHQGKVFRCLKFRTMHLNVDTSVHENYFKTLITSNAPMRKLDSEEDPRIFKAGRLLRASSLDELPQLFNIMRGEMSLVGPRPPIPCEYEDYLPWHRHRVDVLPGLTGLWQVSGKNKTTFTEMMRYDLRYARCQSVWMDIGIIIKTFFVVIGQYAEDRMAAKKSHQKRSVPSPSLREDAQALPTPENK